MPPCERGRHRKRVSGRWAGPWGRPGAAARCVGLEMERVRRPTGALLRRRQQRAREDRPRGPARAKAGDGGVVERTASAGEEPPRSFSPSSGVGAGAGTVRIARPLAP